MKVLLINPPFHRLKGFGHTYYPLGLGYLCAVANKHGIEALLYNAETPDINEKLNHSENYSEKIKSHKKYIDALNDSKHYVWKEIEEVIKSYCPDVVGVTVMTAKYASAVKVSEIVKGINGSHISVVWGGPHPTICTKEVIDEPLVDFAVSGEGEETFEELLMELQRGSGNFEKIKGLAYKKNGILQINPLRELINDLDKLPMPDRKNILFPERYFTNSFGNLITLRGCPFLCGYCSAKSIWSRKCRYRSIDNVISEVLWLKDRYGSKEFYFWDDSFTLNRNRVVEICNAFIDQSINISWGCTTRVDLLDEEILSLMKKAGCDYISIGIESGSERILKIVEKNITIQQIKNAVEMIKNSKISFEAFFMIGFPDEAKEDIEKTFQLMKEMDGGTVCFSIFTPYPGSTQFDIAKKYGLIPEKVNWSDYSHQSSENYFVKNISREQFREYVDKFSQWIDSKNTRDLKVSRLFLKAFNEFPNLIKRPGIAIHKCKTLLGIFKRRLFA
jgi:radical SAM superfamily enzyme YgiQ (UPF0313 family)